jgi:hypothetical protein
LGDGGRTNLSLAAGQRSIDIAPGSPGEDESPADHWDSATLFGRLQVPEETVSAVVPPAERQHLPAKLYVAVQCHETVLRDSVSVAKSPVSPGTYDVQIHLDWEDFRGRVELHPYLVRTKAGPPGIEYASTPNVRLASGQSYEVTIDHVGDDAPPSIDGEEVSFNEADHLPDGSKLYHLDFRNHARPKLWINADNPRVADVLRSEGSVGAEPRMRDVILDEIAYGVWSQLILRTAAGIDTHGNVEYEWQEMVLETFARDLCDEEDITEAAHELRELMGDPESVAVLAGRIDHELQEFVDYRTQLINLMEEGLQI